MKSKNKEFADPQRVSVGKFISSGDHHVTLRSGVKEHRFFRQIWFTDEDGKARVLVCMVETPPTEDWEQHNETRLLPVMRLLEAGREALEEAGYIMEPKNN